MAATRASETPRSSAVFAEGCCFHKLVWLFVIAAFLGDVTETIFCRITAGVWMSRSSVVYGPFSIVWGLGGVMLTATPLQIPQPQRPVHLPGGHRAGRRL